MSKFIILVSLFMSSSVFAMTTQYKESDCSNNTKTAQMILDIQNQVMCSVSADEKFCEDLEKGRLSAEAIAGIGMASSAVGVAAAIRAMTPTISCNKTSSFSFGLINDVWAAGSVCSIGANVFTVAKEQIELEEGLLKDMKKKYLEILGNNPNAKATNDTQKQAKRELKSVNGKLDELKRRKSSFDTLVKKAKNIPESKLKANFGEDLYTRDKFGQKSNRVKKGLKELLGIERVSEEVISKAPYKTRLVTTVLDQSSNNLFREVFEPNTSVFESKTLISHLDDIASKSAQVKANASRLSKSAFYSKSMEAGAWRNSLVSFGGNAGKQAFRKALTGLFFSAGIALEVAASPTEIGCDDSNSEGLDPRYRLFTRGSNCNEFEPIRKLSDPGLIQLFSENSAEEIMSLMLKGGEYDVSGTALCKALIPFVNSSGVRGWQASCTASGVSLQPRRHNYDGGRPYGNRIEIFNTDKGYDVYNSYSPVGFGSNGQYYASFTSDGDISAIRQTRARGHLGNKFDKEKYPKYIEGVKRKGTSDELSKAAGYAHRYSLQAVNQTRRCCTSGSDISSSICSAYGISKPGAGSGLSGENNDSGTSSN